MAKIFRPRRGKKSTMTTKNTVLASGELFVEVPETGVGTGKVKMKMGDGSTAYSSLPYAVSDVVVADETVAFTASTSTANSTLLNEIVTGKAVKNLFGSIKTLLSNLDASVTQLNNNYSSLEGRISSADGSITELNTSLNEIYAWLEENQGTLGDSISPSITVTAPTGTSSANPTYYQSDSTVNYTVSGTATDNSGIAKVIVNGNGATLSGNNWSCIVSLSTNTTHTITIIVTDGAGNTETVTRYVRIEAYYQQAARISGASPQTSLANTLTNSSICNLIANNGTAYGIMKNKYSNDMESYIDSNFNDGLNLLNYNCRLNFYIYKTGNQCSTFSGGWTYSTSGTVNTQTFEPEYDISNSSYMRVKAQSGGNYAAWGCSPLTLYIYNKTARNYKSMGYSSIQVNCTNNQSTNSYNVPGYFTMGTVSTVPSTSYVSGNGSTSITIATNNLNYTVHSDTVTWTLGTSSNIYICFRCTPKYQNGAFGNWGEIIVYSVKICR